VLRYAIRLGVIAIILSTAAVFVIAAGYAQEQAFAVKGVVVDPSGAVISQAEVMFKGKSGTIVAHTGKDGSVSVDLAAGQYVVTVSAWGFASAKLVDFSVSGPTADAFRVSLKIDQRQGDFGSGSDNGHSGILAVPTLPSALPDLVKDEPARTSLPAVQPAITKRRSVRCLYLWRCSAGQQ
jgi:hypothetical protein